MANHIMLADGQPMWWPSQRVPRLRARAGLRARPRHRRRHAGRGESGCRRLVRHERLERPRRSGRRPAPQPLRPRRQGQDVRELYRQRRAHRVVAARLAHRYRPCPRRPRGVVRRHDRRRRARHRGHARLRIRRRAPRGRRRHLHRHLSRLLRLRARPLDQAGTDHRAGDRRDRNAANTIVADHHP